MRCRFGFKLDGRLEISDSSLPDDPVRHTTLRRVLRLQLESQTQFVASSVDVLPIDQGRERQLHSWTHTQFASDASNACIKLMSGSHLTPEIEAFSMKFRFWVKYYMVMPSVCEIYSYWHSCSKSVWNSTSVRMHLYIITLLLLREIK